MRSGVSEGRFWKVHLGPGGLLARGRATGRALEMVLGQCTAEDGLGHPCLVRADLGASGAGAPAPGCLPDGGRIDLGAAVDLVGRPA
eukprot:7082251-Pyramimonas_sp.AAC.1